MRIVTRRAKTRFLRSMRAISPVLSVLMMIAIAVAASLVAYAWIMGYIGGSTAKAGKAVLIQSMAPDEEGNLLVYVQNVGMGAVNLGEGSAYVVDILGTILRINNIPLAQGQTFTLDEGKTAAIIVDFDASPFDSVKVKIVTTDGTFTETNSGTGGSSSVIPAALDRFEISTIDAQVAGVPFSITITAKDQYGATFNGFAGANDLGVSAGTIDPITVDLVSGVWTGDVTVSPAGTGVTISTSGAGKSGISNQFDVSVPPAALDHFEFDSVGGQIVGQAFSITIRAIDQYGAALTSYGGSGILSDFSGTITPTGVSFASGVATPSVTVTMMYAGDAITVLADGKTGTSNYFDVDLPAPITVTQSPSAFTDSGWSNEVNAYADGGGHATSDNDNEWIIYSGYGFSIPSGATITQVRVRLDAWYESSDDVRLEVYDGSWQLYGTISLSGSQQTYWCVVTGLSSGGWTPSEVNGIQVRLTHDMDGWWTDDVYLDWIPIEVTYIP